MTEAIFVPDGLSFIPTEHAGGPWDPAALHGGAPAALMARAIEAVQPELGMFVSRITAEVMRPVPMAPLRPPTAVTRPGRTVRLFPASLTPPRTLVTTAPPQRTRHPPNHRPPPPH